MSNEQSIRDELADEISGIVVGSGYYSTFIGIDAAQEAADAIMPLVRKAQAEAWDEGFDAGERDVMEHVTFDEPCIENPYIEQNSEGETNV